MTLPSFLNTFFYTNMQVLKSAGRFLILSLQTVFYVLCIRVCLSAFFINFKLLLIINRFLLSVLQILFYFRHGLPPKYHNLLWNSAQQNRGSLIGSLVSTHTNGWFIISFLRLLSYCSQFLKTDITVIGLFLLPHTSLKLFHSPKHS